MSKIHYLGPKGSFSHAAVVENIDLFDSIAGKKLETQPQANASQVFQAIEAIHSDFGLLAFENSVEGYVVPNLDALIDAKDVVGIARVTLSVNFAAMVLPHHAKLTQVVAHPHGLAQCKKFIKNGGYSTVAASSNAQACQDLNSEQIGLGPVACAQIYGLDILEPIVNDFTQSQTDFLLLCSRETALDYCYRIKASDTQCESIIAFIPLETGPGVLVNSLLNLKNAGLNMTSFISRPIKGHAGTYSFVATVDAAPWELRFSQAIDGLLTCGDWVRTLAVYRRAPRAAVSIENGMLPTGGIRQKNTSTRNRELLLGEKSDGTK